MTRAYVVALALMLFAPAAWAAWPTSPIVNLPISVVPGGASAPVALADGAGGAFIVWPDSRYDPIPSSGIYAQHVLASGNVDPVWPINGRVFFGSNDPQREPAVVSDGTGGILVAWLDQRSGISDAYVHHMLGSGTLDPVWPLSGVALTSSHGPVELAAAPDGAGGAFVIWADDRARQYPDIYAQHVLASGLVDPAWPVDGLPISTEAGFQQHPKIVVDGAGGAFVGWWDRPTFTVRIHHLLVSGALDPSWPAGGVLFLGGDTNVGFPMIADGSGGVIAAWDHSTPTGPDVFAAHVLVSGVVDLAWPDSLPVCSAPGYQLQINLESDAAGGAFVTWEDQRIRYDLAAKLYAHHVLSIGEVDPLWPLDGIELSTAPGPQQQASIVPDGSGGAIAVWRQGGNPTSDIYAQHVLASGALDPNWPESGRPVCLAADDQWAPVAVSDGSGGAIATWVDYRNHATTYSDIYAQSVGVTDFVGVESSLPAVSGIRSIWPNPSDGDVQIAFGMSKLGRARISVIDVAGREVALVADGVYSAGVHRVVWDGRSRRGPAAPGVYFLRLRTSAGENARLIIRGR
jgi:hypothetical protein